jgi:ribosomal-protein-alanine N-acetyltransferase
VFKENIGSERVLQKAGFKYEGLLRDYRNFKGIFYDFVMYSILRQEFLISQTSN